MPNAYFRFRQFTVWQDGCAMKVCTDACLFGAWFSSRDIAPATALDIGTGTGLLSLMLAQRFAIRIDALEIDEQAAAQAARNFSASPWPDRLQVIPVAVQQYARQTTARYGLIFSNPPFFTGDLKSPDARRNAALHDTTLSLDELFDAANRLLLPEGHFALMLPFHRTDQAEMLAARNGFHIWEKLQVRQTAQHTFFRAMYLFCRKPCPVGINDITIRNNNQEYTPAFREMMREYYLMGITHCDE